MTVLHCISIHALLAESDDANLRRHRGNNHFYPRSPCGERLCFDSRLLNSSYFYPRSPCGERQSGCDRNWQKQSFLSTLSLRRATESRSNILITSQISIHALLAESDPSLYQLYDTYAISIHALLAESDIRKRQIIPIIQNFYPRSPCGERLN